MFNSASVSPSPPKNTVPKACFLLHGASDVLIKRSLALSCFQTIDPEKAGQVHPSACVTNSILPLNIEMVPIRQLYSNGKPTSREWSWPPSPCQQRITSSRYLAGGLRHVPIGSSSNSLFVFHFEPSGMTALVGFSCESTVIQHLEFTYVTDYKFWFR